MTRLDEQMRLRKRLVEQAVELANGEQWEEAIAVNRRLVQVGQDADALNRIGKALLELGRFEEAQAAYNETLRVYPTNVIARKNLNRLSQLANLKVNNRHIMRPHADPQLFVVETGRTALTSLTNIGTRDTVLRLVPGEALKLEYDEKDVRLLDSEGRLVGQLEPQLAQRLITVIQGGNQYQVAVANLDGNQIKVLIREVFQSANHRNTVSFPGKLSGDINSFRTYQRDLPSRYELDESELLEEEDLAVEETLEPEEEDFFRGTTTGEEEEVGLEELEADIKDDDDDDDDD